MSEHSLKVVCPLDGYQIDIHISRACSIESNDSDLTFGNRFALSRIVVRCSPIAEPKWMPLRAFIRQQSWIEHEESHARQQAQAWKHAKGFAK